MVATVAGDVQPFDPDADIALLRLTNEHGGELRGVDLGGSGGTVTLPVPATSVRNVTLAPISAGIAASTGGSAFATTLRTVTASSVSVSPAFAATQPLTFVRSVLRAYQRLSAPAMVFADASRVVVQHGASLDVGRGAGTVSVRADTTCGPVTLTMYQSAVTGSLDQRGGVLSPVGSRSGSVRISGDWTIGAGAAVGVGGYRAAVPPTDLAIGGSARLDGRFVLTADPHTPPVGTVVPVITAARGVTGRFGSVTLAPGYALSYSATAVLATYTG